MFLHEGGKREGEIPTSAISDADSRTSTSCPASKMAIAAPKPPNPAPMMMTCEGEVRFGHVTVGSGVGNLPSTYSPLPSQSSALV